MSHASNFEKFRQPYASPGLVDGQVRSGLDQTEKRAFDELTAVVESWGLEEKFKEWCTEGTLCRYLRARGWDVKKAGVMLEATIKWRREATPEKIKYVDIKSQADSLANIVWGFDSVGHVITYMRVARDPPGDAQQKLDFVIHNIEESTRMMERHSGLFKGVEKMIYVVDLKGFTTENSSRDMAVSKQWTHILANHCPERLHKAYLLNYPTVFKIFWMTLKPFLDPVTRSKVHWVSATTDFERQDYFKSEGLDPDWLEAEYGGNVPNCSKMNCVTRDGYKSYFDIVPPKCSPYNWALLAAALTVVSTSFVLPIELTPSEPDEEQDIETASSTSTIPSPEILAIWDTIHQHRSASPPKPTQPPSICIRRPTGDLRLVPVTFKTTVFDIKLKADIKGVNVNLIEVRHEGSVLGEAVNVYPLADKEDVVLEVRVRESSGCCTVA